MGKCAIYIDGGYLDNVLREDHRNFRIDYDKLMTRTKGSDELLRAYYYHCMPYQSKTPTREQRERYSKKHRFMHMLSHIPRVEVRLGELQRQGFTERGNAQHVQKRVDVMMAVDMVLLAAKHRVDRIALLTGDSDAIPAVQAVKAEGVVVTLLHGSLQGNASPSRELYKIADERFEIDNDFVSAVELRERRRIDERPSALTAS